MPRGSSTRVNEQDAVQNSATGTADLNSPLKQNSKMSAPETTANNARSQNNNEDDLACCWCKTVFVSARLVLRVPKTNHIYPHLASIHWLLIDSRNLYSVCYNCLNSTAPDYMTELVRTFTPTHQLRSSSDTSILCLPSVLYTHAIAWSEVFLIICTICLEDSPLQSRVIQHPFIFQVISQITFFKLSY